MKLARNLSITLICIILGVMLAWQYRSILHNSKKQNLPNVRVETLRDELIVQKENNEDLMKRNDELQKQISKYENSQGNLNQVEKNLESELGRVRLLAGLSEIEGAGVIINLEYVGENSISETAVLSLINELKASEAQAISIEGERIVAMSEIKKAGDYIVVNGKQMLAPFTIKAIADPEKLENSLTMLGGMVENLEYLYSVKVTIEKKDSITIPKVRDDGSVLKYDLLHTKE
ncbi:DUF881 domain-containing protein [Acetivibrio cellulolyticus]|uniref:DUF881 domain-containing protein n=1 Tax=Acetivibrio cellulolyticus TaxID=35830 RepID=UPI0001E2E2C7|nr:DUF881 domain-containing protein [Acetivibrio cellulolyticus]